MKSTFSLELGMPHLGRNNLSENALFKAIGNDRWRKIQEAGKVPTSLIRDDAGSRLYATFFFLEVNFTPEHPLAAHGENETIDFVTDLSHYGQVYLDGKHRLVESPEIWIRSSNVFIYQERGPSKLSMSIPANMDFSEIPELDTQPDSLAACRVARTKGAFFDPDVDDVDIFEGEREYIYQIDADRDQNGAGLVYFANFIAFLDQAERGVLTNLRHEIPSSLLDARTTYHRRIGYYGNAQATDRLRILVKARMHARSGGTSGRMLDIGFDYRIRRMSDEKEILVSSSRKVSPMEAGSPDEDWFSAMIAERA
ncbi:MAG: LnmK family bifunctional acyltransferase/decarboxylase [Gemmatimonadaceae bacterium]